MSGGRSALAWASLLLTAGLLALMVPLSLGEEPLFDTLLYGLLALSLAVIGALIATRQPGNRIGWLFCGLGAWGAFIESWEGVAYHSLPGAIAGEWVLSWSWIVDGAAFGMVFLLFPSGRLLSAQWRVAAFGLLAGGLLAVMGQGLSSANPADFAAGENPIGVDHPLALIAFAAGIVLLLLSLAAAVGALLVRYRHARGVERLQLRQFVYASAIVTVFTAAAVPFYYQSVVVQAAVAAAFLALPIAAGIAILRYQLYDIDILINRTLVYGALTLATVASYASLVVAGGAIARLLSGQESNEIIVAATTLVVAALFQPARHRIQSLVDLRFYRSRYDAARTVEAFQARLRDQVDIQALRTDLAATVHAALQPASVAVWIRSGGRE